jgi:hypothetical protein
MDFTQHIEKINAAMTMDELQESFKIAYKIAQASGTAAAMAMLTTAKNARKEALKDVPL